MQKNHFHPVEDASSIAEFLEDDDDISAIENEAGQRRPKIFEVMKNQKPNLNR